jgi:hypothetical protein
MYKVTVEITGQDSGTTSERDVYIEDDMDLALLRTTARTSSYFKVLGYERIEVRDADTVIRNLYTVSTKF